MQGSVQLDPYIRSLGQPPAACIIAAMTGTNPDFVFLGGLREDYCITHDGISIDRALGGNAVYAAVGACLWGANVGLLGRVGSNFPHEWIRLIAEAGIDILGIKQLPIELDTRTFYAYLLWNGLTHIQLCTTSAQAKRCRRLSSITNPQPSGKIIV